MRSATGHDRRRPLVASSVVRIADAGACGVTSDHCMMPPSVACRSVSAGPSQRNTQSFSRRLPHEVPMHFPELSEIGDCYRGEEGKTSDVRTDLLDGAATALMVRRMDLAAARQRLAA